MSAPAAPDGPVIEIETLSFEGMGAEESRRATAAFTDALSELVRAQGLPEGADVAEIGEIDLGDLPVSAQTPEALGRTLAMALYAELGT